jgi:hypothetical protein
MPTDLRHRTTAVPLVAVTLLALLALLLLPEAASAGGAVQTTAVTSAVTTHETGEAVRWGFLIGTGLVLAVGLLLRHTVLNIVIGADKRLSTSKTIATVWTFVIAAALLALIYAEILGYGQAFEKTNASGVVGQYALLFGGPIGAAILAKTIVTQQVSKDASVKPPATKTGLSDLVANDAGETDLGDLQYVLFNFVALVFVLVTMLAHDPSGGLPHIPEVLLGLTSVSAAGYLGKKMLPNEPMTADFDPKNGGAEKDVTVKVSGLPASVKSPTRFWVKFGEEDVGFTDKGPVVGGVASLKVKAPKLEPEPADVTKLTVTVIPETGTLISAGSFEYKP